MNEQAMPDPDPPEPETQIDADALEDGAASEGTEETFPRSYVEELRAENQRYRERGRRADELARRLHTALVAATGRLADPSDLPFDESHLDDPDTLTAAIADLLARKPHMAARKPMGEIGQGATPSAATVDLAALLRQRARWRLRLRLARRSAMSESARGGHYEPRGYTAFRWMAHF